MAKRLTDKVVRELPTPERGFRINYDSEVPGFACRVMARSAKRRDEGEPAQRSFIMNYRIHGRERRYTVGPYPAWSVAAARREAETLRRQIDQGDDPMAERHAAREAPTVADLCNRYVDEHLPKKRPSGQTEDRAMIKGIIRPRLGKVKVEAVTHTDIDRLHRETTKGNGSYRANRVLALGSKMFNLAIRWGWRADNPCHGVERNPEEKRTRYLAPDELRRLTAALAEHPNRSSADAVRLLLLTGARRGEVLGATWDQIDFEAGVWIKPGATTKQKTEHRVPLSSPALQLLAKMKNEATLDGGTDPASTYLFPGKPGRPQHALKKFWASVCRAAEIEGCRVHDLRHTYASLLASAGVGLLTIGRLLGHTQPATTDRYSHLLDDPLREATERVGVVVTAAGDGGDVVPIKRTDVR